MKFIVVITVVCVVVISFGALLYFANTPGNYIYDSQPHFEYAVPCSYDACCNEDQNLKYFNCDYMGCLDIIPNWTPPNCSREVKK